ncbi:hypothetical protein PY247_04740 [Acinetobacter proteolyticus]|nr:hypothetical protein [Acinetobacter proteolyticus]WEI19317.1 hypothetical protein PY247_04740 [Acinetobacter proteolyticus]
MFNLYLCYRCIVLISRTHESKVTCKCGLEVAWVAVWQLLRSSILMMKYDSEQGGK